MVYDYLSKNGIDQRAENSDTRENGVGMYKGRS